MSDCRINLALVTGPQEEPIDLQALKDHLRITDDANNQSLMVYLRSAREAAEEYLGRGLLTQTWKITRQTLEDEMALPMAAPLQSVTHVKYYDENGTQQTLATSVYDVDAERRPARVVLKPGQMWPSLQATRLAGCVEIQYIVGWTAATLIPERILDGIRLFVASRDADRIGADAAKMLTGAYACWSDRVLFE